MRPKQGGSWVAAVPSFSDHRGGSVWWQSSVSCIGFSRHGNSLGGMEFWCRGVCVCWWKFCTTAMAFWFQPPRLEIFPIQCPSYLNPNLNNLSVHFGWEFLESQSPGAKGRKLWSDGDFWASRIAEDFSWQDLSFFFHSQGWRIQCQYYHILIIYYIFRAFEQLIHLIWTMALIHGFSDGRNPVWLTG